MKVLMFGWEFPPHIAGGLGTACYGLTKGLTSLKNVEVTFVVPKAYGDEDQKNVKLLGAGDIAIKQKRFTYKDKQREGETVSFQEIWKEITYIEVGAVLIPYVTYEEYEKIVSEKGLLGTQISIQRENIPVPPEVEEIEEYAKLKFSGGYGSSLIQEVSNYALVSSVLATSLQFDVIHAHDWLTYPAGISAKRISGKPLVIHVHATEFDRSGENVNQQVYDIEKAGMENADRIITVSNLTRNIVIQRYGIHPDKVITVYNAVEPHKAEKLQEHKKNLDEKIVTFLGRVTFQKGPEYFVEAAHKVLKRIPDVRFVMAGSGDMLRRMIRRTAQLGIMDRFHYTDFLKGDDVNRMFSLSDVYVMPSVSEPFGISPLEAMRSNVPVIISKQSGVAEILKHAIKVDFWDTDAIADAIHGLLKYDALSKMFRRYGKMEVENLKWENAAAQVRRVYELAMNL